MSRKKRLGEILLEGRLISETQLASALSSQKTWGGKLGSTLVRMGFVRDEDLLRCLSDQLRLPSVDFGKVKPPLRVLQLVPARIAEKYNVIPVALKEELGKKTVVLAMSDPTNLDVISEIQFQTGVTIRPVVASESAINKAIAAYYGEMKKKSQYGFEKHVDLSLLDSSGEMVILHKGEETKLGSLDGLDASSLVRLLIDVLEAKGVIRREDLLEALNRRP